MTSDAGPLAPSYTGHPGNRSLADNGTYVPFVELAARDYQAFLTFKRHPHYQAVLEHVSPELGQAYLLEIREAGHAFRLFLGVLERRKEHGRQDCDYRYHYEEFDKGERHVPIIYHPR